ncbi:MAG: trypsin-like peptidase domain-containing protein [Lachnospiraceae bacterium]|nr:trypsin-like peptidase domain-containing protein [Lachnospiraceae bacterium]
MSKEEHKEMKIWKKWLIVISMGLVIGAGMAAVFLYIRTKDKKTTSVMQSDVVSDLQTDRGTDVEADAVNTSASSDDFLVSSSDLSSLVENVLPSVVSVECTVEYSGSGYDPWGDMFGFGFGDDYGFGSTYTDESSGTGFIIGQNGNEILLATNQHVINQAKTVTIRFFDGTETEAETKGSDSFYDVAVLSVNTKKLSDETLKNIRIATIGNSDKLSVGDMTIAIGNSLGYGQSVTVGYISALDRTVTVDNREMQLMQTDTEINEGNNGGPLINIYGEVIGITNTKYDSYSGGKVEGMSFAIPISKVIPIINELMNRVDLSPSEAGYLGIEGKEVSESYSKAFDMPKGLYVSAIDKNSPALEAGIRKGDIITAINGRSIKNMDELKEVLSYIKYGTEVEIKYSTRGSDGYVEKTVNVVLGKRSVFETDKS